jgi:pyruvate/2-oxoglutarate dehydrogenase complex dihydrolipoamide acyltransferase (E2) component
MAAPLRVPRLGVEPHAAVLAEWYAPDGAAVSKGQSVARVETDAASIDIPAEVAGTVHHLVHAGVSAREHQVVGEVRAAEQQPARPPLVIVPRDGATSPAGARPEPIIPWPAALERRARPAQLPFVLRLSVDATALVRMGTALAHEWRVMGVEPGLEDFVIRAVARAFRQDDVLRLLGETILLVAPGSERPPIWIANAASRFFREAATARVTGGDGEAADSAASCVVTTYAHAGVAEATPEVDGVRPVAITIGTLEDGWGMEGERPVPRQKLTLAMAVDRSRLDDDHAVVLAARIRGLIESPYELLGD